MVQADPVQRSLTVPYAAHVGGDDSEPCRNEAPREIVKIADAAARIREQEEGVSGSIDRALETRFANSNYPTYAHPSSI
jgi:hypothetical protein